MFSIIVPCFNEAEVLPFFYKEFEKVISNMGEDYKLMFIDDGSTDQTLETIKEIKAKNVKVSYISFSRNFGKEAAIYAGLSNAVGEYVAIMDADLQDPPSLLPEMLSIVKNGRYDSAATRRVSRKGEPAIRSFFARLFYRIINHISDANIVDGARDYRLMNRKMVDAVVALNEYNRFSKGIFGWVGFRTKWLEYENVERAAGETKWSFWKLFKYAVDGIINFSQVPLAIASWLGVATTGVSILAILFLVIRRIAFGDPVAGWASTVCIVIFIGGIQLLSLGIMGQYVAKTYMESKHRPHYIVAESDIQDISEVG